jgi:hypothetical protein
MKKYFSHFLLLSTFLFLSFIAQPSKKAYSLFDGKTFNGWEGDTNNTWRIENGTIVGGSLIKTVPNNDFLCTTKEYSNFILKIKIKLVGNEGFINSGIQFRSKRLTNPAYEMTGYQADWGNNYWASLYDESRRNKTLMKPDSSKIMKWIKINDWNDYKIVANKNHIQLYINGKKTVDYTEVDNTIPQTGLIGVQVHGGGKAQVSFKDIYITELP